MLVHLGLDTVQLNGEGFTAHVAQGDTVEAGQPVITYDAGHRRGRNEPGCPGGGGMDEREPETSRLTEEVRNGSQIDCCAHLFHGRK